MSRVVHCQRAAPGSFTYVGRPSIWGNPFIIGIHGTRAEVIAMYEGWLRTGNSYTVEEATEEKRQAILNGLPDLRGKVLGCWCGTTRGQCHAWVLLDLLDETQIRPDGPKTP